MFVRVCVCLYTANDCVYSNHTKNTICHLFKTIKDVVNVNFVLYREAFKLSVVYFVSIRIFVPVYLFEVRVDLTICTTDNNN